MYGVVKIDTPHVATCVSRDTPVFISNLKRNYDVIILFDHDFRPLYIFCLKNIVTL